MKLDTRALRHLTSEDWRVLTAVEQGSKNHELVPTPLIRQIAGLRGGTGVHRCISALAKVGLVAKVKNAKYDGYRLTYGGLDYLALNSHRRSGTIYALGNQIGVGKESDIFITAAEDGRQQVLKLHRLGRISFRTVKANRDYLRNRSSGSWMYLSRLAAQKEHAFMNVLHREGFPVPEPLGWSRHTVVMEFIDSFPLRMIESVPDPAGLYAELMHLIVRLARRGLIHGDFNEFNILIREEPQLHTTRNDSEHDREQTPAITLTPIVIDFPQMLSTTHANAQFYFDRDVACITRFFERRFGFTSDEPGPFFADATKGTDSAKRLDLEVEATGFNRRMAKELEGLVGMDRGDLEEDEAEADEGGGEDEDGTKNGYAEEHSEVQVDGNAAAEHEAIAPGSQIEDLSPAEQLDLLSMQDSPALKPGHRTDLGLTSLDLPQEPDQLTEKVRTRKKAAGWAI